MDAAPPLTVSALAPRVLTATPRLGGTRLVCVDGPAGSGKTTLAARLADALPGTGTVHMDDLYAGWTLTGAAARLSAGVLRPLSEGRPGAYHRFDWAAGRFRREPTPVPAATVLVVEGCGSASRTVAPWACLRVWVEADPAVRLARGLARDGASRRPVGRLATDGGRALRRGRHAGAGRRRRRRPGVRPVTVVGCGRSRTHAGNSEHPPWGQTEREGDT